MKIVLMAVYCQVIKKSTWKGNIFFILSDSQEKKKLLADYCVNIFF